MSLRLARQLLILALALALWASVGRTQLLAALVAYLAAIGLASTPALRAVLACLSARQVLGLSLLLALPGLSLAYRARDAIAEQEGLHGLGRYVSDRLRLETYPAIAPALVSGDRAQTFFVLAPGTKKVSVRFGPRSAALRGEPLSEGEAGLYRVQYDPRRDGLPEPANGELEVLIQADGHDVKRSLRSSTPLAHPRWLTVSPNRQLAATVSEESDELVVVDLNGLRLRARVADAPSDCAFLDDAHIIVSHLDAAALSVVDLTTAESTIALPIEPNQVRLALSPTRSVLAVALAGTQPAIAFVARSLSAASSAETWSLVDRVKLDATPDWLAFGRDDSTLFVSTRAPTGLLRLHRSAQGYEIDSKLELVRPVVTLARSLDGSQLMLAVTAYEPDAQARLGNHFVQDTLLLLDTDSMQVGDQWLTARRSERQSKPGDVDRGLSPMGILNTQAGRWLISFAGSDEIWRASSPARAPSIVDLASSPMHAPHSAAELADGTLVITSPSAGAIGLLAPKTRSPKLVRLAPDDAALLATDRNALARRLGERGFYEATRSGISCQSCHLHADSDDSLHNLGGRELVSTLSVRGLACTAPYLRDGSYPRIADLDELAQTLYRGYLRRQAARGDTLEAYIESLPRSQGPHERDPAAERRGYAAFVKARCPTCHVPPAFTNLGAVPMHWLFPDEAARTRESETLDTLSLLSLASSAPYLNDGRAATLPEVISKYNRRNRHGDTAILSARERTDLVTFLSSL